MLHVQLTQLCKGQAAYSAVLPVLQHFSLPLATCLLSQSRLRQCALDNNPGR